MTAGLHEQHVRYNATSECSRKDYYVLPGYVYHDDGATKNHRFGFSPQRRARTRDCTRRGVTPRKYSTCFTTVRIDRRLPITQNHHYGEEYE